MHLSLNTTTTTTTIIISNIFITKITIVTMQRFHLVLIKKHLPPLSLIVIKLKI